MDAVRVGFDVRCLVLIALLSWATPIFAQPLDVEREPAARASALLEEQSTLQERLDAAHLLVKLGQWDQDDAVQKLKRALEPKQPIEAKRAVLVALSLATNEPPGDGLPETLLAMLETPLGELESDWARALGRYEREKIAETLTGIALDDKETADRRRLAVRALGEHRRLYAAKALVEMTQPEINQAVRGHAYDALGNLTHQPQLGRDAEAWSQWYRQARRMNAREWQDMLHDNLLRLSREREAVDARVREKLTQSQRALYRATAVEQRPVLLANMLQDPVDLTRSLAIDLARQLAEDNGEFGPELRAQLRGRLSDPLPSLREQSATLLGQLLDAEAADMMAARLSGGAEIEPSVRLAYLMALGQLPRESALSPANAMLDDPALRSAAAGVLAAAYRAGLGDSKFWSSLRDRVQLMLADVNKPRPQMVTLLGLVIKQEDAQAWSRISGWLTSEDERVRESAARVWAASDRSLVELANRSDDPVVRPIALRAIAERGADQKTLKAVASRRPTEPEDIRLWEQAMVGLAKRVPPEAVLATTTTLAKAEADTRAVREQMLTGAIEREDAPDPPTKATLALLLARAKTRVLADAPALVVLDYEKVLAQTKLLSEGQADQIRRSLTQAYLSDRRIDNALATAELLLRPDNKLIEKAADDPLVGQLIQSVRTNLEQGRKDEAIKLLAGVRVLLDGGISAELDTELLKLKAETEREVAPPAPPADPPTPPAAS